MAENILDILRARYHDLNAAEQKVASCVLERSAQVQNMSISELAQASQVSDATVTRFCRRLSLSGFFAFKLELAKCGGEITEGEEEIGGLSGAVAHEAKSAVDSTLAVLKDEDIEAAVSMLERADRVLVVGYGSTALSAAELVNVFSVASLKFFAVSDTHSQTATVSMMTERDLLVLFSYSGSTLEGTELLRFAKEKGIPTLLITHFAESPSAKYADALLCHAVDEHPYRAGSVPVRIAQLTLIDLLWRTYEARNGEICRSNIRRVADALAKKHT